MQNAKGKNKEERKKDRNSCLKNPMAFINVSAYPDVQKDENTKFPAVPKHALNTNTFVRGKRKKKDGFRPDLKREEGRRV
jgi:hypothetical protein